MPDKGFLKEADLITAPDYVVIKAAPSHACKHALPGKGSDRLHLLQDHRLGLVLPQHDLLASRGLQANHCRAVDNGSCYISGDLAEWLEDHNMDHVRGAPFHPQTQGKIPSH